MCSIYTGYLFYSGISSHFGGQWIERIDTTILRPYSQASALIHDFSFSLESLSGGVVFLDDWLP